MNNRKLMVGIEVDENLKVEFESLKEIHEMTFSDALEIGIKISIKSTQSTDEVRRKINDKKTELQDLYAELYYINGAQRHPQDDTDFKRG